jgi:hypothetical protein
MLRRKLNNVCTIIWFNIMLHRTHVRITLARYKTIDFEQLEYTLNNKCVKSFIIMRYNLIFSTIIVIQKSINLKNLIHYEYTKPN